MADVVQVVQVNFTIAPGTAIATPATQAITLPNLDVAWLEWRAPYGFNGVVGFWVGSHGQQIIPFASGGPVWIVANDESAHWDLTDQMDSGDWQVTGYNLGSLPHTVYLRFGLAPPTDTTTTVSTVVTIPNELLTSTVNGA